MGYSDPGRLCMVLHSKLFFSFGRNVIGAELYPDNQSPLDLFQCYSSKFDLSITCMSVSRNLIIKGILLLSGYPHTCADFQSLSILISTTSTAWDQLLSKVQLLHFFVLLKLSMPFPLHLSIMDETNHSSRELPRNKETLGLVI